MASTALHGVFRLVGESLAARGVAFLLALLSLVASARLLGPHGRGQLAAVLSWASLLAIVGSLSLDHAIVRRAARSPTEPWVSDALAASLVWVGLAAGVSGLLTAGMRVFPSGTLAGLPVSLVAVSALLMPLLVLEPILSSFAAVRGELRAMNRALVLARSVGAALLIAGLLALGALPEIALAATVLGQLLLVVLLGRAVRKHLDAPLRLHRPMLGALLRDGALLHVNAIGASWVTTTCVLLLLQRSHGPEETAFFSLANDLAGVPLIATLAVGVVLRAETGQRGVEHSLRVSAGLTLPLFAAIGLLIVAGAVVAPFAVPLVAGVPFAPSVGPFRWLLLGLFGHAAAALLANQWVGRGYLVQASLGTVAASAVGVALAFWLIPGQGIAGAIIGSLAAQAVILLCNAGLALHLWRAQRP